MTSQWSFSELFLFFFFRPPDPKSEKKSRKSTNKKNSGLSRGLKLVGDLGEIVSLILIQFSLFSFKREV